VLTHDDALAEMIDSVRVHGKAVASDLEGKTFEHETKYLNMRIGLNSRLDTIQAAVLIEKLKVFGQEIEWRNRIAARYNELPAPRTSTAVPVRAGGQRLQLGPVHDRAFENRDGLAAHLKERGRAQRRLLSDPLPPPAGLFAPSAWTRRPARDRGQEGGRHQPADALRSGRGDPGSRRRRRRQLQGLIR
jgi:dTDP-4-amino-4,6-dideoxygalactose transaminase